MSSPKRRSRQPSASSSRPYPRLRGRQRQRQRTKVPSSASSSSSPAPAPSKKRKTRHATQHTDFFAIKDIVAEKFVDGKRFFKIDWEDNPVTGEPYEPTWVSMQSCLTFCPVVHENKELIHPTGACRKRQRRGCSRLGTTKTAA